jgi:hypothetical protein
VPLPEARRRPLLLSADDCRLLASALSALIQRPRLPKLDRVAAQSLRQRAAHLGRTFEVCRLAALDRAARRAAEGEGAQRPAPGLPLFPPYGNTGGKSPKSTDS